MGRRLCEDDRQLELWDEALRPRVNVPKPDVRGVNDGEATNDHRKEAIGSDNNRTEWSKRTS